MKITIESRKEVELMVNTFYESVRQNTLLGPIFEERIKDNWPAHLEKMYNFWETVLLGKHNYFGSPFAPHMQMGLTPEHFETWIGLFVSTIDCLFEGEKAEEAKWRATKMAEMFRSKIEFYKQNNLKPIV